MHAIIKNSVVIIVNYVLIMYDLSMLSRAAHVGSHCVVSLVIYPIESSLKDITHVLTFQISVEYITIISTTSCTYLIALQ